MKEISVLCPECFKVKLETADDKNAKCPHCGEEFEIVAENRVRYKEGK
jgi:transcription initiation factor IIE alpha subunit